MTHPAQTSVEPCLQFRGDLTRLMADTCWGFIPTFQCQEAPTAPLGDPPEMGKACGLKSPFQSNFWSLGPFQNSLELEVLT